MESKLYQILEWAKENGEVKIVDRIRIKVLPITIRENIYLNAIQPDTECSEECIEAVRDAVVAVIGKSCPIEI